MAVSCGTVVTVVTVVTLTLFTQFDIDVAFMTDTGTEI